MDDGGNRTSRRTRKTTYQEADELDFEDSFSESEVMDDVASEPEQPCAECGDFGEVLLCDTCSLAYHLDCVDPPLNGVPDGSWSCPKCGDDKCILSKLPGATIQCRYCLRRYRPEALSEWASLPIPQRDVQWRCHLCCGHDAVEKILAWRLGAVQTDPAFIESVNTAWRNHDDSAPIKSMEGSSDDVPSSSRHPKASAVDGDASEFRKEYLVKWKERGFWHCTWVSEALLKQISKIRHRNFMKLVGASTPPKLGVNRPATIVEDSIDDLLMNEVLQPGWLEPHRLLSSRSISLDGITPTVVYLTKWTELLYADSTWEAEFDLKKLGYHNLIDQLNAREAFGDRIGRYDEYGNRLRLCPNGSIVPENSLRVPRSRKFFKLEAQPEALKGGTLHPYQLEGVNWLRDSWFGHRNVILADEMGLGKTIQTTCFIRSVMMESSKQHHPFLIVVPLSTIGNWERELNLWCPELNFIALVGNQPSRELFRNVELYTASRATKFHVLLTSFEMASTEVATLRKFRWESMIIDEAHRLKSGEKGRLFQSLHGLKTNHRVLLTGTPLQNTMEELFHLLLFLEPDKFADLDSLQTQFSSVDSEGDLHRLRKILEGHMLRRLKSDVKLDIPEKHELIVRVELTPVQKEVYKAILTRNYEVLNRGKKGTQTSLLNIVMQLKKLCNHQFLMEDPGVVRPDYDDVENSLNRYIQGSGKLALLDRMLVKLKEEGHRVLIFSQMTSMLDFLEDYISLRGWGYQRLDGNTSTRQRQSRIDAFNRAARTGNQHQFIFLLSTRAGGQGINLATADTVIIYDADWNPHNDLQALARAHRIGQKHKVMIYRFVTRDSVEERILQMAKKKLMLEHVVVQGAGRGNSLSQDELNSVLKYGAEQLFSEEKEAKNRAADPNGKWGDGNTDSAKGKKSIIWDDEAIEKLLDRNQVSKPSTEKGGESESKVASFLNAFNVAKFSKLEEEQQAPQAAPVVPEEGGEEETEEEFDWASLLGDHHARWKEEEHATLGKGKRERRQARPLNLGSDLTIIDDDSEGSDYSGDEDIPKSEPKKRKRMPIGGAPLSSKFSDREHTAWITRFLKFGARGCDWEDMARLFHTALPKRGAEDLEKHTLEMFEICHEQYQNLQNGTLATLAKADPEVTASLHQNMKLVQRAASLELMRAKVAEFEQSPSEFVIKDSGSTSWISDCSPDWTPNMDHSLLAGVLKHGYGNWLPISADETLYLKEQILLEVQYYDSKAFELDPSKKPKDRDESRRVSWWVKRRVGILEKALAVEAQLEHYSNIPDTPPISPSEAYKSVSRLYRDSSAAYETERQTFDVRDQHAKGLFNTLKAECADMEVEKLIVKSKERMFDTFETHKRSTEAFCNHVATFKQLINQFQPSQESLDLGEVIFPSYQRGIHQIFELARKTNEMFQEVQQSYDALRESQYQSLFEDPSAQSPPPVVEGEEASPPSDQVDTQAETMCDDSEEATRTYPSVEEAYRSLRSIPNSDFHPIDGESYTFMCRMHEECPARARLISTMSGWEVSLEGSHYHVDTDAQQDDRPMQDGNGFSPVSHLEGS